MSLIGDEERSKLTLLPVNCTGVIRHFTPEEGLEPRSLDPLLFMGVHPKTGNLLYYSVQDVYIEPDGRSSFDALVFISWPITDKEKDAIPSTNRLCVANVKERAKEFYGLFRRLVDGIPDDTERVASFTLADFAVLEWDQSPTVTLAGDAAHAMTMYRVSRLSSPSFFFTALLRFGFLNSKPSNPVFSYVFRSRRLIFRNLGRRGK